MKRMVACFTHGLRFDDLIHCRFHLKRAPTETGNCWNVNERFEGGDQSITQVKTKTARHELKMMSRKSAKC